MESLTPILHKFYINPPTLSLWLHPLFFLHSGYIIPIPWCSSLQARTQIAIELKRTVSRLRYPRNWYIFDASWLGMSSIYTMEELSNLKVGNPTVSTRGPRFFYYLIRYSAVPIWLYAPWALNNSTVYWYSILICNVRPSSTYVGFEYFYSTNGPPSLLIWSRTTIGNLSGDIWG